MAKTNKPSPGRKSDKIWTDALRMAVMQPSKAQPDKKRIQTIAEKCVDMAESGDLPAMKEVFDRIDGKPAQAIAMELRKSFFDELAQDE